MSHPQPSPTPPRPEPLDPPMVPFAVGGMAVWAVVGLVLLIFFRDWLADHGHINWLWICLAGFLVGFPGLAVMLRHDANRRRRLARLAGASGPGESSRHPGESPGPRESSRHPGESPGHVAGADTALP